MATGLFVLVVTFTPFVEWAAGFLTTSWSDTDHGVLIVLSGDDVMIPGADPTLAIGSTSYWRAMHAIYVWRHSHFSTLLLSGDHSSETIKPLLVANGIPEAAILVEDRSHTTRENATFCQPILANLTDPYVLLTSDYHTYRASRAFTKAMVRIEAIPAPDLLKRVNQRVARWQCFWDLAREYTAIVYYRFKGWI